MAEGSPHDYEAALQAETADLPLDYPGRGKLDVHAAARSTLSIADRFRDVVGADPALSARLTALAGSLEASQRRREALKGAALRAGTMVVDALTWYASYNMVTCDPQDLHMALEQMEPAEAA